MAFFGEFAKINSRYAPITLAYGALRKTIQLSGAKLHDFKDNKEKDMYYTSKFGIITLSAFATMSIWPFAILKDIYKFEGYVRGDIVTDKKYLSLEYLLDY